MKKASNQAHTLLIEWSPTCVRTLDPSTGHSTYGASIADCLADAPFSGDAIIAVTQRSAFIRSLYVPNGSRAEIASVIELQLPNLLPLPPSECVFGFRTGALIPGKGRIAVVGAIRAESLRRIYAEAKAGGLNVRAVVPLAFGSWLAARAHSLSECAVVEAQEGTVAIDIVRDGELAYSRSVPMPKSASAIDDEVARTFAIAEAPTSPILAIQCHGIEAAYTDAGTALQHLSDTQSIEKLLFTLEPPEKKASEKAKIHRWRATRAIAAAVVAASLGTFAVIDRTSTKGQSGSSSGLKKAMISARSEHSAAIAKLGEANKLNQILDVAFQPGQSFGDMVNVLANSASPKSWFTDLFLGRGLPISINGYALSDSDVAQFIAEVSKDPRFQEMKVVSTSKTTIGKKPVTSFQISGKPLGSIPFDHPPKEVKHS